MCDIVCMLATAEKTGNVSAFDAFAVALRTVTLALPAEAIRLAGTVALSWVALIKLVAIGDPFHSTFHPLTKPEPLTVSVKAAPPAMAEPGLSPAITGGAGLMVNVAAFDKPPPGLSTVTLALPGEAISLAGMAALSWVALTKVVVTAAPFHSTTDPFTNPAPFRVSVNAGPPAIAELGLRPFNDIDGTGEVATGEHEELIESMLAI
jgi:hypothetical protein